MIFDFLAAFYVDPETKRRTPTFYLIWFVGSVLMGIVILPWYIYFMIRRPQIRKQAAAKVRYELLDVSSCSTATYWKMRTNKSPNL
ncbi:unnamed protein product [Gongylonema pulchrum]|uniref:Receptor expression-enhancing protein n=1 Tax=Gongylonema pulchrum TaxID=637853 RepID=A0A183DXN8_9BILA|nr:unnamed protein product [Gongylonema pulchrum]